ncbi:hypothetical protein [Streptomyces diastatochromogenes]|uniref:hypothetical protein n=1 Tax=Streptomyces diastatochromogenes TaxID=42236 RepID=UPI00365BCB03
MDALHLTDASRILAGVVLLTVPTIEIGGWFMTRIVRGLVPMTPFQKAFARAGHAHAGVLVILSLVCLLYADAAGLTGAVGWIARLGVPASAILLPGGFFASSAGRGDVDRPNGMFALVWAGAAALAIGVVSVGVGLLTA